MAENEHTTGKAQKSYVNGYSVSKAHRPSDKNPTVIPMLAELTFLMAITFTSLGVDVTPEINMEDKKRK